MAFCFLRRFCLELTCSLRAIPGRPWKGKKRKKWTRDNGEVRTDNATNHESRCKKKIPSLEYSALIVDIFRFNQSITSCKAQNEKLNKTENNIYSKSRQVHNTFPGDGWFDLDTLGVGEHSNWLLSDDKRLICSSSSLWTLSPSDGGQGGEWSEGIDVDGSMCSSKLGTLITASSKEVLRLKYPLKQQSYNSLRTKSSHRHARIVFRFVKCSVLLTDSKQRLVKLFKRFA